ncbi:hypothetical protein M378DRAFT_28850 [Amanita muscaria Koide BX008]|uniref:Uncharacterized protein n=1 Tax=Amanita muscaria (strain Koide BX008) TaxID=946122 RepID=A0A0C2RUD0_AMAMK|nr:hypothetical protein M378DRAFT_28850 [Amanita muscaria Koide BX008]
MQSSAQLSTQIFFSWSPLLDFSEVLVFLRCDLSLVDFLVKFPLSRRDRKPIVCRRRKQCLQLGVRCQLCRLLSFR